MKEKGKERDEGEGEDQNEEVTGEVTGRSQSRIDVEMFLVAVEISIIADWLKPTYHIENFKPGKPECLAPRYRIHRTEARYIRANLYVRS